MSQILTNNKSLTRYRVTLDVLIDSTVCDPPGKWDWEEIIGLGENEALNDCYVENLGDYTT